MLIVKGNTIGYTQDFKLSLKTRIKLLFKNSPITVQFTAETVKNGDKMTTKADCKLLIKK